MSREHNSENVTEGLKTWEKPGLTAIKPNQAWTKPVLERLSLRDAANTTVANTVPDMNTNS